MGYPFKNLERARWEQLQKEQEEVTHFLTREEEGKCGIKMRGGGEALRRRGLFMIQ